MPVLFKKEVIGEIAINAFSANINLKLSSNIDVLQGRIEKIQSGKTVAVKSGKKKKKTIYSF